jgi:hypothetical protein
MQLSSMGFRAVLGRHPQLSARSNIMYPHMHMRIYICACMCIKYRPQKPCILNTYV